MTAPSFHIAERAARESYGRLLAMLVKRTRNIAAAEDALSHAFLRALETWHTRGIPDNPDAWILQVAHNAIRDLARHERVALNALHQIALTNPSAHPTMIATDHTPLDDDRLAMLFLCAHPAIDESVRAPLMLQTVLGIDAQRLTSAFLLSPSSLAQRLVRAKAKIRASGPSLEMPDSQDLPSRLDDVLACIYTAFTVGSDALGRDPRMAELSVDALWLGELALKVSPNHAEALGLLALMRLSQSRAPARLSPTGGFVPLSEQDTSRWDRTLIEQGEDTLRAAARLKNPGRFQLEAAIQSAHCDRLRTGITPWPAIANLYRHLLSIAPTIGARCGYASALAECDDLAAALDTINQIDAKAAASYQPYWATRASVLSALGHHDAAAHAFTRAIGLSDDPAIRAWLFERLERVSSQ